MGTSERKGKFASVWSNFIAWIDERFPLTETFEYHMSKYYAPKNFNIWYVFGVLSLVVLVMQLVTGIWLTMNYQPSGEGAFASVEYIMRDVEYGWLLRYLHSTGASAFFVVVYLHMFRALMYGSYKKPRELLWLIGILIFVCLMAEGFFDDREVENRGGDIKIPIVLNYSDVPFDKFNKNMSALGIKY